MNNKKNSGLGKGLNAIIQQPINVLNPDNKDKPEIKYNSSFEFVPVDALRPNSLQPRIDMNVEKLKELSKSIKEKGVIEPLLVSKIDENLYEIIAGERRWRAAKMAGLKTLPVIIKEVTEVEKLEIALIENIQRQDLNPLEEALAIEQLNSTFGLSHEEIATKLGISRPAVSNKLRLLNLPEEIKKGILDGKISEGHAKALLGLHDSNHIMPVYKSILKDFLSVRATEELVRRMNIGKTVKRKSTIVLLDDISINTEKLLREKLGPNVFLTRSMKGGKIVIKFNSDNELTEIVNKIIGEQNIHNKSQT
ncbi:MAG: ParB/RepB/Spo0J family partition protein [Candidatus Dojkabacteria bacterium]|nr:ParB/RepB/Spo0J family partition protein [Candidatus Dojkabacteria bacterium]